MGTTLTGTTPQDTYDSLIKVTDNGPIGATPKLLSDGLGNDSSLALSTTFTAVRGGQQLRLFRTDNATYGSIEYLTGTGGFKFDDANGDGYRFAQGANTQLAIGNTGNVGIGTSAPAYKLQINASGGNGISLLGDVDNEASVLFGDSGSAVIGRLTYSNIDDSMRMFTNGSEKVRILSSGGIAFNGDTAAANALDDYEEGTWTMGIAFGGASVGVTTTNTTGTYTKIGRQVTVNGVLSLSSKGSSSGTATITGLPFTIGNSNPNFASASLWLINISFANQFQAYGNKNTTTIVLTEITEAGVVTDLSNADFANNSEVMVNFTYFV